MSFKHWIQQPSTLTGLSLLLGGISGLLTGAFHADIATTLIMAALPKLLPDNTTLRTIAVAATPAVVSALDKRAPGDAVPEEVPGIPLPKAAPTPSARKPGAN